MSASLRVGIDIGGTFTDLLLLDSASGAFWVSKILTTPEDPARGVAEGLAQVLALAGATAAEVGGVMHGTTLVTNALIERKGDRTALVTTRGFRDAIEIAREHRFDMYDIFLERPQPLAPRQLRFELHERLLADGSVYRPVDGGEVRALAGTLQNHGVGAVAVCLLHCYANPAHEREVGQALRRALPDVRLSLSCEVVGEIREYERASTTLANVYVQRVTERYLHTIQQDLRRLGCDAPLLVMLSSGGLGSVETASAFPVRLIESGPAAGALAAAHAGRLMGRHSLLSFDMGGTTAKACLIEDGEPTVAPELEVDRVHRFVKGSGLPIKMPSVEMVEIGTGGGSIARVDRFGLIKVGPQSAGAQPGPVCYGQGGTEPTVTDANLVLGYLDDAFFLGGSMRLDREGAARAIQERLATPLGLSLTAAAWAVHQSANENMAAAARMHAIERGRDARSFPLFAFGGAGPIHAHRVADILGVAEVIVPLGAGVGSTFGLLTAPIAFDLVRSLYGEVARLDWAAVRRLIQDLERDGRRLLAEAGVAPEQITATVSADVRLKGQAHWVTTALSDTAAALVEGALEAQVPAAFDAAYRRLYRRPPPGVPLEAFNWRVRVSGPRPAVQFASLPAASHQARKGQRPAYFPEYQGFHDTPVYDRYALARGARLSGPAIIEERESTAVLGPGAEAAVDERDNLIIALRRAPSVPAAAAGPASQERAS